MPEYVWEHFDRSERSDFETENSYIGLAIAENLIVWDLLEPRVNATRHVPERAAAYEHMTGSERFRTSVASFASQYVWGRSVEPDHVITLAGAGSILENLFYVIGNPGEGVLVPTPSYAGYWADIETRDEQHVVPVHTIPANGFRLDSDLLQAAYDGSPVPVCALLLTNPDNPTGRILDEREIKGAITWARSVGIHVVVNEVYALSTLGETPFVSAGSLIDELTDDIHFVWSFSKDFAMSGFRVGVMTTTSAPVRDAVSELAYWSVVSGDTQHLLCEMLDDTEWVDSFLTGMRARLSRSYESATSALTKFGIPHVKADAGLFVLCDFRGFLQEASWEAEHRMWRRILDEANVNLTPGSACHIREPGFMRLCFAREPADIVVTAIDRIATVLASSASSPAEG